MTAAPPPASEAPPEPAQPPRTAQTEQERRPEPEDEELLCTICGLRACWQK